MRKHKSLMSAVILLALLFSVGCGDRYERIKLRTPEKDEAALDPVEEQASGKWDDLVPESSDDPKSRPKFMDPSKADQAPRLSLERFGGQNVEIDPARTGRVTIVVFWAMDSTANRAAVIYAYQLVNKFRQKGLRGVNVVEKPPTDSHRAAPKFLRTQGIDLPTYYDDFTALRKMAKAAGESVKWEIPIIFLIDKRGRVRFFMRGFSSTTFGVRTGDDARARIRENAPEGEGIKDYIRRLLKEE